MNKLCVGVLLGLYCHWASGETLLEAMQTTIDTHPEVQAAKLERRSRQHEIYQAKAGHYPEVSLAMGVGREDTRSPSTNDENVSLTHSESSLNARLGLFEGFATQSEVERQQAREQSAKFNADSVVETAALNAAKAYIDVLRQQALLELAKISLENHQNIYDQMASRRKSGVGSQADLDQITGRLALANTNAITAQSNFLDACRDYERVVGRYPDVPSMAYPGDLTVQLPATEDEMVVAAIAGNPILRAAHADVDAATAQHEAAKSPFYPRLTLEAEKSLDEDVNGVEGEDETTLIALRLRYDLFTGGKNIERKRQTAYLLTESQELRNDTHRKVVQAAHLNWNAYQAVVQQLPYLEQHVQASSDTKKSYYLQFNVGRRTLLDLLNTENEEVDARRALLNGRHDWVVTQLQVLSGVGKLVEGVALTQKPEPKIRHFFGVKNEVLDINQQQKEPATEKAEVGEEQSGEVEAKEVETKEVETKEVETGEVEKQES